MNKLSSQPKVALVHDDFCQLGGAERLFEEFAKIFPDSPVYTSLVDWSKVPQSIAKDRIRISFLQKIPFAKYIYKILLPLYPLAFENFNFSKYYLVISSTTRFAKSIITKPATIHICYINSLPRFLYNKEVQKKYLPKPLIYLLNPYFSWLKRWDKVASSRVDLLIANSQNVADQIKRVYKRNSIVINPFADTTFFKTNEKSKEEFFLVVNRLVSWKRIDLVIKAAIGLNIKIIIVGTGPQESDLKKLAKDADIKFLKNLNREELRTLYQKAKGVIVTQEEDFGISIVEAQACGTPVIAYKGGGQKKIIIEGKTGIFFDEQTVKSIEDALKRFSKVKWSREACRKNSLHFTKKKFIEKLKMQIATHVN